MTTYCTEIRAVVDDQLITYAGPYIEAETSQKAQEWLNENGMEYCRVVGELTFSIDAFLFSEYEISMN